MSDEVTVKGDNLTLDMLLVRKHGFAGQKLIEKALTLNRGLAAYGEFLPVGTVVLLPDLEPLPAASARETIDIFG